MSNQLWTCPDELSIARLYLGPESKRWAAVVCDPEEHEFVVVDGELGPRAGYIAGLSFSADGTSLGYALKGLDDGERMWVDGELGNVYQRINKLCLSADGSVAAYAAKRKSKKTRFCVVVNGKAGPNFLEAGDVVISPSGQCAYWGMGQGKHSLMVDGAEAAVHKNISGLVYSDDGETLGYFIIEGEQWRCVVGGETGPTFDWMTSLHLAGGRVGYAAARGERGARRWLAVVDGEEHGDHDNVDEVAVAATGERWAYRAEENKKWRVHSDAGAAGKSYDWATSIKFSSGGEHLAYVAKSKETYRAVLDDEPQTSLHDLGKIQFVSEQSIAYRGRLEDRDRLYRDGEAVSDAYDRLSDPVLVDGQLHAIASEGGKLNAISVQA
jgi:hypothetical protein